MSIQTAVFDDTCPNCGHEQESLVGYLSHCQSCGTDWRSYRCDEPVKRWHSWTDSYGRYNDFVPGVIEAPECSEE